MARFDQFTQCFTGKTGYPYRDDDFNWKFLWHFTVVPRSGTPGTAYRMADTHPYPPHFWVDYKAKEIVQGIDTVFAGYALRNLAGGVETNADRVIQVEILANEADIEALTEAEYKWLGEVFARPIIQAHKIPFVFREQYGTGKCGTLGCNMAWDAPNDKGMSNHAWDHFAGHLGHQDAPENDHTDPGPLDLGKIIKYAQTEPPKPEPDPEKVKAYWAAIIAYVELMQANLLSSGGAMQKVHRPDSKVTYLLYPSGLLIHQNDFPEHTPVRKPGKTDFNRLVTVNDAVREILGKDSLSPGYIKKVG